MNLEQKIKAIVQLKERLSAHRDEQFQRAIRQAEVQNRWFTRDYIESSLAALTKFLNESHLRQWLQAYQDHPLPVKEPKKVGVVMAGNIPLVGFHDFLCVLISGHTLLAKLSKQDTVLMEAVAEILTEIEPQFAPKIQFVPLLKDAEAYIATGSNNSSRYFEYYFSKKPNLIRKNRNSCAIISGEEATEDFQKLAQDIFLYFGLGCRNVSKLFVPENYDFSDFLAVLEEWSELSQHNKYANNYDYNRAVYTINQTPYLDNGFVLLKEDLRLASPVATIHYETYHSLEDLEAKINEHQQEIQVLASRAGWFPSSVPFGKTQEPELWDYADGIDTMKFLLTL